MVSTRAEEKVLGTGLANLGQVSKQLINLGKGHKIWLFNGEMGSGKTTLIKDICDKLGVSDNVTSPTFSIINEYQANSDRLYHFDLYRVKTLDEAIQAGVEEYLYSGCYCFIEWPKIIIPILPKEYLSIDIDEKDGQERVYKISYHGTT